MNENRSFFDSKYLLGEDEEKDEIVLNFVKRYSLQTMNSLYLIKVLFLILIK